MEKIIKIENVKKTFILSKKQQKIDRTTDKYKVAVDNLSFETYKGEIYGLLGPNGAGKTTTLRMLSTLIKPDCGNIIVDGIDACVNPNEVRKMIRDYIEADVLERGINYFDKV